MSKKTFSALDHSYDFDTHGTHHGYHARLAVNIKCYHYPKLSDEYKAKLETIKAHGLDPDKLEWEARERTQEDWWAWVADRSVELDLGPAHSTGRSGGWLVLKDWGPSKVEEWLEDREERCVHCDGFEHQHVNDQCLFAATSYTPVECVPKNTISHLDCIQAFFDEVRKSVDGLGPQLLLDWEQVIDDTLAEFKSEKTNDAQALG